MYVALFAEYRRYRERLVEAENSGQEIENLWLAMPNSLERETMAQMWESSQWAINTLLEIMTHWSQKHASDIPLMTDIDTWTEFTASYQQSELHPCRSPTQNVTLATLWQRYLHLTEEELRSVFEFAAQHQMQFDWSTLQWKKDFVGSVPPSLLSQLQQMNIVALSAVHQSAKPTLAIPLYRDYRYAPDCLSALLRGAYEELVPESRWREILQEHILDEKECEIRAIIHRSVVPLDADSDELSAFSEEQVNSALLLSLALE